MTMERCWWADDDPLYIRYHDEEWGRPVDDDIRLFEKISLEGFQAGLSWITILRKRESFREAFDSFDFRKVALYDEVRVEKLLQNEGIIRHRGKIEATINNAQKIEAIIAEYGSFAAYIWSFEPTPESRPQKYDLETVKQLTDSPESVALSKDLKKRGFKFVGPTTIYAFMQSMGLVNDHTATCPQRAICEKERANFKRPLPRASR